MLIRSFIPLPFIVLNVIGGLLFCNPTYAADNEVLTPSPSFLKKKIEDFYSIPPAPSIAPQELAHFIDLKIQKYGSRIPKFDELVNEADSHLTVKALIKSSALNGLPNFGNKKSKTNQDLRKMVLLIFERLENLSKIEEADRRFLKFAQGFLHCQQVQYRTIRETYLELMDKDSLKTRVALLLDDLKAKWLMQTIFQMEEMGNTRFSALNPHLESAYLNAIGEDFGISGTAAAKIDRLATKKIDPIHAKKLFLSFARADEIISHVYGNFTSSQDPQEQAEVFNWVSKKNYELDKIYDEEGLITQAGVEKILLDLEVLAWVVLPDTSNALFTILEYTPATLIQRQEAILEAFFPTTGYSTWAEFEGALERSQELAPVREALDHERTKLVVYAPQTKRNSILTTGLLNQYQTHSSSGYLGVKGRFAVERGHLNMPQQEYEEIPAADRPKYGQVLSEGLFAKPLPSSIYGEDVYTLKIAHLRDRLTWTPPAGSSLSRHALKAQQVKADWKKGNPYKPTKWDDLYLPWSKRRLLVPLLDKTYFFRHKQKASYGAEYGHIHPHPSMKKMSSIIRPRDKNRYDFVEFQAWGKVSPDDLESFTFTKERPNRETLKFLLQHQIATFDGTDGPRKPYQTLLFERGSDGKCRQMKFVINLTHPVTEDVESSWCDLDVGNVVYHSAGGDMVQILDFEIGGLIPMLKVQSLNSNKILKIKLAQAAPTTLVEFLAHSIQAKKLKLSTRVIDWFFNQNPTLQQILTFANIPTDKFRIRRVALQRGYASTPQNLIDLYSNIGDVNFPESLIVLFFDQNPTLQQVIALANIHMNKSQIRQIALDKGFASTPQNLIDLYSNIGGVYFGNTLIVRFFDQNPTPSQVTSLSKIHTSPSKFLRYAARRGYIL